LSDPYKCRDCGAPRSYISQYCPICESSGPHILAGIKPPKFSKDKTVRDPSRNGRSEVAERIDYLLDEESQPKNRKRRTAKQDSYDDAPSDRDMRSVYATKSQGKGIGKSTRLALTYGALALLLVVMLILSANTIINGVQKLANDLKSLTSSQTQVRPTDVSGNPTANTPQTPAANINSENTSGKNSAVPSNQSPDKPAPKLNSPATTANIAAVDTVPPKLVGQPVVSPNESSATISWKTDEKAVSQVKFGYTASYQFQSAVTPKADDGQNVYIDGLSPDMTYHYQLISTDAAGNVMVSADYTFKTDRVTDAAPYMGSKAPNFTLKTLDGKDISLSQFRGRKVILNFWASWCTPCKIELPHFQAVWDKYSSGGDVMILTVAGSQSEVDVLRSYISSNSFNFIVCLDSNDNVFNGYQINSIPKTYFLDKSGVIRRIQQGMMTSPGELEFMLNSY
jgi:peroxiredoxin